MLSTPWQLSGWGRSLGRTCVVCRKILRIGISICLLSRERTLIVHFLLDTAPNGYRCISFTLRNHQNFGTIDSGLAFGLKICCLHEVLDFLWRLWNSYHFFCNWCPSCGLLCNLINCCLRWNIGRYVYARCWRSSRFVIRTETHRWAYWDSVRRRRTECIRMCLLFGAIDFWKVAITLVLFRS